MSADNENYNDEFTFDQVSDGIVLRRIPGGAVMTNVPHLVTHHSPTGYEFGYAGSGPADLALNICEMMLNRLGYKGGRENCWRGDCWRLAFQLHQEFKFRFIATVSHENGATLQYTEIESWFKERLVE